MSEFNESVGRKKSNRWVRASVADYEGGDWNSSDEDVQPHKTAPIPLPLEQVTENEPLGPQPGSIAKQEQVHVKREPSPAVFIKKEESSDGELVPPVKVEDTDTEEYNTPEPYVSSDAPHSLENVTVKKEEDEHVHYYDDLYEDTDEETFFDHYNSSPEKSKKSADTEEEGSDLSIVDSIQPSLGYSEDEREPQMFRIESQSHDDHDSDSDSDRSYRVKGGYYSSLVDEIHHQSDDSDDDDTDEVVQTAKGSLSPALPTHSLGMPPRSKNRASMLMQRNTDPNDTLAFKSVEELSSSKTDIQPDFVKAHSDSKLTPLDGQPGVADDTASVGDYSIDDHSAEIHPIDHLDAANDEISGSGPDARLSMTRSVASTSILSRSTASHSVASEHDYEQNACDENGKAETVDDDMIHEGGNVDEVVTDKAVAGGAATEATTEATTETTTEATVEATDETSTDHDVSVGEHQDDKSTGTVADDINKDNSEFSRTQSIYMGSWKPDTSEARGGFVGTPEVPAGFVRDSDGNLVNVNPSSMRVKSIGSAEDLEFEAFPDGGQDNETIFDNKTIYDDETLHNVQLNNGTIPGTKLPPLPIDTSKIITAAQDHDKSTPKPQTLKSIALPPSTVNIMRTLTSNAPDAQKLSALKVMQKEMNAFDSGLGVWMKHTLGTAEASPYHEYKMNVHVKEAYSHASELSRRREHTVSATVANVNENVTHIRKKVFNKSLFGKR